MSDIITKNSDGVLRIQLNRPASKNALTSAMYIALADLFDAAMKDDAIRAVLWHGAGDSFCAGNDIGDFLKNPPGKGEAPQATFIKALMDCTKPIVAAVQGAAIGGGATMLMHCDVVFAGESAKFQFPFVNLGLVPEFASSCTLPARIGHLRAAELILLGQSLDARRAEALGVVTRVVPDQNLLATATEATQKLAAKPASALQTSKRLMKQPTRAQLEQAVKLEIEEFAIHLDSEEAKEAFTAFLEKRAPNFSRVHEPAMD